MLKDYEIRDAENCFFKNHQHQKVINNKEFCQQSYYAKIISLNENDPEYQTDQLNTESFSRENTGENTFSGMSF